VNGPARGAALPDPLQLRSALRENPFVSSISRAKPRTAQEGFDQIRELTVRFRGGPFQSGATLHDEALQLVRAWGLPDQLGTLMASLLSQLPQGIEDNPEAVEAALRQILESVGDTFGEASSTHSLLAQIGDETSESGLLLAAERQFFATTMREIGGILDDMDGLQMTADERNRAREMRGWVNSGLARSGGPSKTMPPQ